MIFGRTDLRKGVSGAKRDAEADFEVRLAVALRKPSEKYKQLKFEPKCFQEKSFRLFYFFSVSKDRIELKLSQTTDLEFADVSIFRPAQQNKNKTSFF